MARKTGLERQLEELDGLRARGVVTDEEYASRRTAIISQSGSEAAPKGGRGKGIMKWGAFGCLGILAVVGLLVIGLIVIIAAAVGGSADKTADSGGDVRVALATGAQGVISPDGNGSKRSQVTILEFVDAMQPANQFSQPAAGKKYVGFNVRVENVGTREVTSLSWKLRDSKDNEYDSTLVVGAGQSLAVAYNLTPGGKSEGWVYFEIAADATVKWLRADPNPFLANDLYFDSQ